MLLLRNSAQRGRLQMGAGSCSGWEARWRAGKAAWALPWSWSLRKLGSTLWAWACLFMPLMVLNDSEVWSKRRASWMSWTKRNRAQAPCTKSAGNSFRGAHTILWMKKKVHGRAETHSHPLKTIRRWRTRSRMAKPRSLHLELASGWIRGWRQPRGYKTELRISNR